MPVVDPIVATAMLPLLQVPPVEASDNVVIAPVHTVSVPDIAAGNGLTVMVVVIWQLVPKEYVIVGEPDEIAVTKPAPDIVASAVLLLLQVPPLGAELNVAVAPTQ